MQNKHELKWKLVNFSEIDKYAIKSYCSVHGVSEDLNLGDVASIKEEDMPSDIDLVTYGFPCITGDALVLTNKGFKPIKDVEVGEKVLSHDNQYHSVIDSKMTGLKNTYKINAMCFDELNTTESHLFLARERYREWNNDLRMDVRKFKNPKWVNCGNLTNNHYLGYAINQKSIMPIWNGVVLGKERIRYQRDLCLDNMELWYICGRYLGDGWIRKRKDRSDDCAGVVICCGKHKATKFEKMITIFNYNKVEERTAYKYIFSNK